MDSSPYPTFPGPPASRAYVHMTCGSQTVVDGDDYQGLCHPYVGLVPRTLCVACGQARPLREFAWADTGESLDHYRRRLRGLVPLAWRVIHPLTRWLLLLLPIIGIAAARAWMPHRPLLGPVLGFFAGLVLGLVCAATAMTVDDRDFRRFR